MSLAFRREPAGATGTGGGARNAPVGTGGRGNAGRPSLFHRHILAGDLNHFDQSSAVLAVERRKPVPHGQGAGNVPRCNIGSPVFSLQRDRPIALRIRLPGGGILPPIVEIQAAMKTAFEDQRPKMRTFGDRSALEQSIAAFAVLGLIEDQVRQLGDEEAGLVDAVSYTHLTLPT